MSCVCSPRAATSLPIASDVRALLILLCSLYPDFRYGVDARSPCSTNVDAGAGDDTDGRRVRPDAVSAGVQRGRRAIATCAAMRVLSFSAVGIDCSRLHACLSSRLADLHESAAVDVVICDLGWRLLSFTAPSILLSTRIDLLFSSLPGIELATLVTMVPSARRLQHRQFVDVDAGTHVVHEQPT